jgi:hypothetical protein
MGSAEVASCSIWNQWSMTVKVEQPPSSAARAVAVRIEASDSGWPGRVKSGKWMASLIVAT